MATVITRPSTIVGPDGQPLQRQILLDEQAGPTLGGVRTILSEHPSTGLTPQRLAALLRAAEEGDAIAYLDLAEELEEKFVHYRAVLTKRKLAVSQLEITVEAASDAAEDVANADLVREVLCQPEMADVCLDLMDGVGKGFAVVEILWDLSEREWRPERFAFRLPTWFQFDRVDGVTLRLRDQSTPIGLDLAPYKYLVHRPRTKSGLPIRAGLARAAAWPFLFHAFAWKDWLSFVEIYGHPIRLGKYGPGATAEERATLLRAVRNIATDFAAIIPDSMIVDLVQNQGASANADIYDKMLSRLDQLISKLVLGGTASTDAIAGGHAVGKEHREIEEEFERGDARQLAGTLSRDLAIPLVALNRGPQKAYPTVRVGRPDSWDAAAMMPAVASFVALGGEVEMSVVRDRLGLPDPPPGAKLLMPAKTASPGDPAGGANPLTLTRDAPDAKLPSLATSSAAPAGLAAAPPDAVDQAVEDQASDWEPLMTPIVDPIKKLLDQVTTLQELRDRLPELLQHMDPAELVKRLGALGFNARVASAVDAAAPAEPQGGF